MNEMKHRTVNVDRMRRYSEAARDAAAQIDAKRVRREWLARMTPEHRAWHESPPFLGVCADCVTLSLASLRRIGL